MFNLRPKTRSFIIVTVTGFTTFLGISVYKGNDQFYKNYVMPIIHKLDPEKAHRMAVLLNKYNLMSRGRYKDPNILKTTMFGKTLSNPIGLAAGFDKHAEAVVGLRKIGFGFVEVGSVTPLPQPGNASPRVFRLSEDKAVVNRYGFNSDGHQTVLKRVHQLQAKLNRDYCIGVNLGKNKMSDDAINDYVEGIRKFGPVCEYLVINISSPNTPNLRNLQSKNALSELLKAVVKEKNDLKCDPKPPLLLKLAPDLSLDERRDIANVLKNSDCRVDGLIISNTTVQRPNSLKNAKEKDEVGGLSGEPLKDMSTQMITDMYKFTNGMPIIGVGGIFNGKDAYEKIRAGAALVQIYTSLIYEGPPVVSKIKKELAELLEKDGFKNVSEAVGVDCLWK